MRPLRNYDVSLALWARAIVRAPLVWGSTDCLSIVRYGLRVAFGEDPLAGAVPTYETLRDAAALADRLDWHATLIDAGARVEPRSFARPADVLLGDRTTEDHPLPGLSIVVPGAAALTSDVETGVAVFPLRSMGNDLELYRFSE